MTTLTRQSTDCQYTCAKNTLPSKKQNTAALSCAKKDVFNPRLMQCFLCPTSINWERKLDDLTFRVSGLVKMKIPAARKITPQMPKPNTPRIRWKMSSLQPLSVFSTTVAFPYLTAADNSSRSMNFSRFEVQNSGMT
jgi:hypothetical protein